MSKERDLIKVEVVAKKAYYSDIRGNESMHDKGAIILFNKAHMSTLKSNMGTQYEKKLYLPSWAKAVGKGVPTRPAYNPNARPKPIALSEIAKKGSPAFEAEKKKFAKEQEDLDIERATFQAEKEAFEAEKAEEGKHKEKL